MSDILEKYYNGGIQHFEESRGHGAYVEIMEKIATGPENAAYITLSVTLCESKEEATKKLMEFMKKKHELGDLKNCIRKT